MKMDFISSPTEVREAFLCVGYFDPDGIFFSAEGYDECGGYYDGKGIYREADYREGQDVVDNYDYKSEIEFLNTCIDSSKLTCFKGTIVNLPLTLKPEALKEGLTKHKIKCGKIGLKKDEEEKFSAEVEIIDKESAKEFAKLHGTSLFGDIIDVDIPDITTVAKVQDQKKKELQDEGYDVEYTKKP